MKGFFVFASSIGGSFIDIALNLAVIKCFTTQKVSYWLQVIHGVFGIGGFMGPFIVYLFEL
jgi:fucose permease